MNFIIIGDKFQKRMKSKGCVALIKINKNKTILEYQYIIIKKNFPEANIIYVYGFDHKRLDSFVHKNQNMLDISFIYNQNYETYNTTYSLNVCQNFLNDDCFVMFGENMLKNKIFNKFNVNDGSQIFINNDSSGSLGCIINDKKVENIAYDLHNKLSEIYFLKKNDTLALSDLISTSLYNKYFLFEMLNKLIDQKHNIIPYYHK